METRPRPLIERLVGLCLPAACREQVLGDLCERYTSESQYLADAARTVPFVLASRARRTLGRTAARAGAAFARGQTAFSARDATARCLWFIGALCGALAVRLSSARTGRPPWLRLLPLVRAGLWCWCYSAWSLSEQLTSRLRKA
jgi:hypothetical protein